MAKRIPVPGPTFAEVLAKFQKDVFDNGQEVNCPCCHRLAKVYKRKLNSGMAYSLIWLYHQSYPGTPWINVPKVAPREVSNSREFDKLEHWGFVERAPHIPGRTRTSGKWRITRDGMAFAQAKIRVSTHVYLYQGEILRFEEEYTSIQEALGSKFDYQELMEG